MTAQAQPGARRGLVAPTIVRTIRGILCLPAVASALILTLVVRIKVTEGFWVFHPFTDPPEYPLCCAVHVLRNQSGMAMPLMAAPSMAMPFWLLGVPVVLASPLLFAVLWMLRDRPTYRFLVPCLVGAALVVYTLFDVRGWTSWCFD